MNLKINKKFKTQFNKSNDNGLKFVLYLPFKDYKNSLIQRYEKIIQDKKVDLNSRITEIIMFNNMIFNAFNEFREKVELFLEIKSNNYNGEYNRFKMCPYCNTIWFKIKGCNIIVCGKRSTIIDKVFGRYKKYIVRYEGGQIKISIEDRENEKIDQDSEIVGLTEEEKKQNINREEKGKAKIIPVGCGRKMKWEEMIDVSEKVIRELKQISVSDYDSDVRSLAEKLGNDI